MKITYKGIDNHYCKAVIDLILPIQINEFGVPITLEDQPDLLDIEGCYQQSGGNFWAAFHEEQLVGTIGLLVFSPGCGAIRKMFVHRQFRGKEIGIANTLLEVLIDFCKIKNINDLYLGTVEMLHAAHRFYERNGFKRIPKEMLPHAFPLMKAETRHYHLSV